MQRPSNNPTGYLFGYNPTYPLNNGNHFGVDFYSNPDKTIYAPEDGYYRVTPNDGTLGNSIHMYVGNRHHAFGHTSKYLISDNQFCKRGTPIAIMGATGAADGVHLHWALKINGVLVDPLSQVNEAFIGGNTVVIGSGDNWYARLNQLHEFVLNAPLGRDVFNAFVGKDTLTFMEAVQDHPIAGQVQAAQKLGTKARDENWEAQLAVLNKRVTDMEADKQAWVARATTAEKNYADTLIVVKDLQAQLAVQTDDTKLLNGFGEWLQKIIKRLGMKG